MDVLYLFGIRLSVRFMVQQRQFSIYYLLLAVKAEVMSLLDFAVRR
jgi:hypothetical protein